MNRPIRVLEVLTSLTGFGGIQQLVTNLAVGLDPARFQVEIATGECDERYLSRLRRAGIVVHRVPLVRPIRPWTDAMALRRLVSLMRRGRYDIVHTHMSKAGLVGRLAARLTGTPVVIAGAYNFGVLYFRGRALATLFWLYDKCMIAACTDLVLADSETVRREVIRLRMIPAEKIVSFTTGIDLERFRPGPSPHRGANDVTAPLVVGTVARLIPAKGLEDLVRAADEVTRSFPAVVFRIVGDGPQRSDLEALILRLGLSERVAIQPARALHEVIHGFDVFVLSSRSEGLPQSILEAMAAERPIVTSRVGGVEEVVTHGESGLVVPPGNPEAMAQAILTLLRDPRLRVSLAKAARQVAEDRFPVRHMVSRIESVYLKQWAMAGSRSSCCARGSA